MIDTLPEELSCLLQPLWVAPDDFVQWGIVADYCEEYGLTSWCDCIRYIIREKRVVFNYREWHGPSQICASWYVGDFINTTRGVDESQLPQSIFQRMPEREEHGNSKGRFFNSVEEAYIALFTSWGE